MDEREGRADRPEQEPRRAGAFVPPHEPEPIEPPPVTPPPVDPVIPKPVPTPPAPVPTGPSVEFPFVLFPVRLETRFSTVGAQSQLLVRVYPDAIAATTHEPGLTDAEQAAGTAFWQAAWDPAREAEAWGALIAQVPAARAAWIARLLTPTNVTNRPAGTPTFPSVQTRAGSWTRAAETRVLPDAWVLRAYRGGVEVRRAVSNPIRDSLVLTLAPDGDPAASVDVSGDGLRLDADVAWTVDFARAEAAGMALRVPLQSADMTQGFDRLVVAGLKLLDPQGAAQRVETLLDSHHYTGGLAFVAPGTPTNNTVDQPAGFPPPDPGGAASFAVERGPALATATSDGTAVMRALGVRANLADHLSGAERTEQRAARAMYQALWPATLGYFLEQMMAPVFSRSAQSLARAHFVEHVRSCGHFPAFRVGATPYGLLPVSSLTRWRPRTGANATDTQLPPHLRTLRQVWMGQVNRVPRVGRTADPDGDLLATLAMDASAREVRVRAAVGRDLQWNLFDFLNVDFGNWSTVQQQIANAAMTLIGHPEWRPRIAGMTFADDAPRYDGPLVADAEDGDVLPFNYIRWIRTAPLADLRDERLPANVRRPMALLYRVLRHAMLVEYDRSAFEIQLKQGLVREEDRREPELVSIVGSTKTRLTSWQRFARPISTTPGSISFAEHLQKSQGADTVGIRDLKTALTTLEGLPAPQLERLFTETLDACSHRLDAWITSLPAKRLQEMRALQPLGCHIGAFGWVEDLRPAPAGRFQERVLPDGRRVRVQTMSGGYVQAPTQTHAAAAAVLRNGYLSRSGDARARYAIDLSSERVRTALHLLDSVREGQPLGAVLGYRFELGLHEGHRPLELNRYIEPLRRLFPVSTEGSSTPGGPTESLAARGVVDGLRLRAAFRSRTIPFGTQGLPAAGSADHRAVEAELRTLDDAIDAVADLLTAESVYQIVRGNPAAASATLDALSRGARPPEPEVARQPRGGTTLTHRVALVLGGSPLPAGPGWPTQLTPRAAAEPYLDGWAGTLIGNPSAVSCRVSWSDPTPTDPSRRGERTVTLAQLGIRPLDVLALAGTASAQAGASELDLRVADAVLRTAPTAADIRIVYAPPPGRDPAATRTFPEILELARAIDATLRGARPLGPADLLTPEAADSVDPADTLSAEASARATAARGALAALADRLDSAIDAVEAAGMALTNLADLQDVLREATLFGLNGGLAPGASSADLSTRAASVRAELRRRLEQALAATDPTEIVRYVFGREYIFLPRFKPAGATELGQALTAGPALVGDANATRRWLQTASRVRPALGRWRMIELYAGAFGAPTPRVDVAQLPHVAGARWVALPFASEAERPPSGRVSLLLNRAATPAAQAEWVGVLLDEWTELIPARSELTGVAFHYDDPGAEAPQAVLVAVPPGDTTVWDVDTLVDIVNETLDLAKLRAVDGELLGALGQVLPAIYLAANSAGETVSTDFSDATIQDPRVTT
jgi:hypothetical protein